MVKLVISIQLRAYLGAVLGPEAFSPAKNPLGDSSDDVSGVGADVDFARGRLEEIEPSDHAHELHAIIGRHALPATQLLHFA